MEIKESDLYTFAGLSVIVTFLMQGIKKFMGEEAFLKKPFLNVETVKWMTLGLTYAIGLSVKLTMPDAFGGASWLFTILGLFGSALTSLGIYSAFLAPLKKSDGGPSAPARLLFWVPVLAALCLQGCGLFQSPNKQLIAGIEGYMKAIEPEYREIVIEGKPRPTFPNKESEDRWKKIRSDTLLGMSDLLDTFKK